MLPTVLNVPQISTYVGWFTVIYLIAAYIRLYPNRYTESKLFTGWGSLIAILIAALSVIACILMSAMFKRSVYFWFVSDSNKLLALAVSVMSFMFFKNIRIKNSKFINTVASTTFGVLLIHANSGAMSNWLWKDVLHVSDWFWSGWLILHAIIASIIVFIVCSAIDYIRILVIEKPLFKLYDKIIMKKS